MTGLNFEKLCEEYGVGLVYSKKLGVYLLMGRSISGNTKSVPLTLETLRDLSDQKIEDLVAHIALTGLLAEGG